MATSPLVEPTTDGDATIELDEEVEGDEIGSRNYRFCKIGEPVPIRSENTTEFDPQCLPSQPLAVSQRFRLLFVVHPQGFYVARTKDVMASAEEIKEKQTGPSIQELSLVDLSIGKVSILTLSTDESLLAAIMASQIHFFAVSALLHKEQKPSYSVSLDDSVCIKDMRWARNVAKVYVILSTNGKLYHGSGQGPPSYMMEDVDSVDWSARGNFVAVAKKNTVSILSSKFKEQIRFLLQFKSVIGDFEVNQVIKVDSIRWIRTDCIAVGCFQLNEDGEEENYIVQLITSGGRRITDATSKPIVLSFTNVFMDFCSDAVPARKGPHMFLSYQDLYGLAFVANRNLSRSVGLFCWSLDSGKNEAAMVEILNDAWTLYIDPQGNDEENVILGLSVDNVSQNENIRFMLGDKEMEVSPCCVILCLTIDGKISLFHFASAAGASMPPEGCASDEEDDTPQVSMLHEPSLISSAGGEESRKSTFSTSESHEVGRLEVEKTGSKFTITNDLSTSCHVDVSSPEQTAIENTGQPLVNSQTVEMDKPEKALFVVPNQDSNAETQLDLKQGTGISGKVVGDFLRPLISSYPLSGRNVQPLGKVQPINSPSGRSLTRSTAKVEASNTSDGRSSSLLSDEVGCSDEHALQTAKGVLRNPADLKEKAKPSVTFTSFGQTASTPQGSRNFLPAYPGKVPLGESGASGKPFQSEFKKDLNAASSATGLPHTTQNASKQFGNVEEMAKKMDTLLEGIESTGGFFDASITSQTNFVIELEEGIWALFERCRRQRGLVDKQLRDVQLLLDKTVQVLVRKVYMEGIFKQATENRYWELWDRQKLSSELELKKKCISELNQELTNKLIELERHFNSLEFNKFGEDGGVQRNRRVLQNSYGHSRQIQSLQSLHNTTHAQLAAAEQLSGCLSKQMAALSIESSGKHDIKKKLFESIGLFYAGDGEKSPARSFSTPSSKEHFITSGSISAKEQSRRNQASLAKSYEPETARRRRDSLDRSWASFEPPRTTVQRMLKEDDEKGGTNRLLLNIDKKYRSPQLENKSEVAHSSLMDIPGAFLNHFKSKGTAEIPVKQSTESPSTSLYQRSVGLVDSGTHMSSTKTLPVMPPRSVLETRTSQNSELGALKLSDEKSKSSLPFTVKNDSFAASESKFVPQFDTGRLTPMLKLLPEWSLVSPSDSTGSLDPPKIGFTQLTNSDQKNSHIASEIPSFDPNPPIAPESSFSPNISEKVLFSKSSEKPSQLNDGVSASISSQSISGSSLLSSNNLPSVPSFVSKPYSSTLFSATPSGSAASLAAKQEVSQPRTSDPSSMNFASTLPLSTHQGDLLSISASSSTIKAESLTSLSHPSVGMHGSKTEPVSQKESSVANMPSKTEKVVQIQLSASQPGLGISTSDLKIGPSSLSTSTDLSIISKSGSQIDLGGLSKSSTVVASAINLELPSTTQSLSPVVQSNEGMVSSVKNAVSDSSYEEEMDEEAPETDQTTEFTLGNLGGFGIGSTPISTTPKSNPFGVAAPDINATFTSSPYVMSTPSGELFRPASFSFESPPAPSQPTNVINFSGGFSSGSPGQLSAVSGFGQPAHIGAGQQALGSVLGTFGQSRLLGAGLPGSNVASAGSFGSGFAGISTGGFGFTSSPSGGGFASLATGSGGFAAAATAGGGFVAAATAGGGFAAAATAGAMSGGGFGSFSNQQGSGGFSAFSGSSGNVRAPSELFTQMRR